MVNRVVSRLVPAAVLAIGLAMVWSSRSQKAVPLAGSLETVLPTYGDYKVKPQEVSDEERRIAGMTDYVARAYFRDTSLAFTAYVGYYDRQTQGKTMHSPRNCLPGAGWEIMSADSAVITANGRNNVVNKYMLKNGPYQAVVLYWYQGRGRVVASEYAVKWNLLRDAALEGHTEEALVRVVAFVEPDSVHAEDKAARAVMRAEQLALQVGTKLLPDVERVLPSRGSATRSVAVLR